MEMVSFICTHVFTKNHYSNTALKQCKHVAKETSSKKQCNPCINQTKSIQTFKYSKNKMQPNKANDDI